ncbi:MAG TPA: acetyl-CoA carboxylase biotin carboxyl carrier protein [Tepidisphaeraceae bacterium]|nr:acetyl-CoA carboxylase biotin carboxyl carrier protein [Tepidisphaeraceae bacterium]
MSKKSPKKKTTKAPQTIPSGSPMDIAVLGQIVQLMKDNDLTAIEVRDGTRRVVLNRGTMTAGGVSPMYVPQVQAPIAHGSGGAASSAAATPSDETAGLTPIKSPMVGTFYTAASPDAKAFVQVGSIVDQESDVCIIEAMKVFNNIKAECRGTIAKIQVENGATVEFGQVLFLVKP